MVNNSTPHIKRIQKMMLLAVMILSAFGLQSNAVSAQDDPEERLVIDTTGGPVEVTDRLRELGLVPGGGTYYEVNTGAYVEARREGYTYVNIRKDLAPRDFVMQFRMLATVKGKETGCGMFFRVNEEGNSLVFLTNDRRLYLAQTENNESIMNFYESIDDLEGVDGSNYELDEQIHTITIIANRDTVMFFLNGLHITTQEGKSVRGTVAAALWNERGNKNTNLCEYDQFWVVAYR